MALPSLPALTQPGTPEGFAACHALRGGLGTCVQNCNNMVSSRAHLEEGLTSGGGSDIQCLPRTSWTLTGELSRRGGDTGGHCVPLSEGLRTPTHVQTDLNRSAATSFPRKCSCS